MTDRYTIISITCDRGTLTVAEAKAILASGKYLNRTFSQIVMGNYASGSRTSLKGRKDGLYYMSGSLAI